MACANAIVATDVGDTWRLVDDQNGLRVQPSADAIAEGIIQLLENPNLRKLGEDSRQRILEEYYHNDISITSSTPTEMRHRSRP